VFALSSLVIAIDGPAGAGKTTIAKRVAQDLDLQFLDTGAMYRCVALECSRTGLSAKDGERAAAVALRCKIEFGPGDPQRVLLNGEDVTDAIRTPEMGDLASVVSVHPAVRRQMVKQQKAAIARGGVILEGRDTTTVVAPDADVKVFLTASADTRALRRYKELNAKGLNVKLDEIRDQIIERDRRDSTRADSPLTISPDANVINTDVLTIDEVVEEVEALARASLKV